MIIENADAVILTDFNPGLAWSRNTGPYRIATEIRNNGYSCQVVDCYTELSEEELLTVLTRTVGSTTKILGLSTTFIHPESSDVAMNGRRASYPFPLPRMLSIFNHVKNICPKIKIVIGGTKAKFNTSPGADTLILGLADVAIIDYLKYLDGKNPFLTYSVNDAGQMVIDGDTSHPNFDFQNSFIKYEPHDNILQDETLAIEISRGCIFNCKFCSYVLNGKKKNDYIKHDHVLRDEFLKNYYEYGVKKYIYVDDTHNDNLVKLQQLANIVQSLPFKLEYSAYMRLDLLRAHPEQYQLIKDGGLKGVFFGIETLNYESSKFIGKGMTPEKTIEELHNVQRQLPDVSVCTSYIVGLPKETKQTILEWTSKLKDPDFPSDGFQLNVFGINKNAASKGNNSSSFLDKNAEKYYKFKNDSDSDWILNDFDRDWATTIVQSLSNEINYKHKVSGFAATTANSGTTVDYSKRLYIEVGEEIHSLKRAIRKQYINKLFEK